MRRIAMAELCSSVPHTSVFVSCSPLLLSVFLSLFPYLFPDPLSSLRCSQSAVDTKGKKKKEKRRMMGWPGITAININETDHHQDLMIIKYNVLVIDHDCC